MCRVSVIVPVYQVEAYLPGCLDSILAQTFEDFELILVDDGTKDGCPRIMAEYAAKDARIRQVHKANGGLSSARNAGLDIARASMSRLSIRTTRLSRRCWRTRWPRRSDRARNW